MTAGGLRCSFCGKAGDEVVKLIAGPGEVLICDACVALCNEVLAGEVLAGETLAGAAPDQMGPMAPSGRGHPMADWRGDYIAKATKAERDYDGTVPACVFCTLFSSGDPDEATNIVWRGRRALAILNVYPYSSGHLMVMPVRHVGDIEALEASEETELWACVRASIVALKAAYAPDGINLGVNLGRAAGAGIPAHLHVHLVPRWSGDTSFMTTIANTRVLPEALALTRAKLAAVWPVADR